MPKVEGKILVHSDPDLEDGALAIIEELHRRGHEPLLLSEGALSADEISARVGAPVPAVPKSSLRGRWHFLTAPLVFTTHEPYTPHRPPRTQTVVNLWHGEALTKAVGRWEGGRSPRPTRAITLSEVGKAFRCAEFGMDPAQVSVLGAPRNDRLLRADRSEVRARTVPDLADGRLLLWLPTYRRGTWSERVDGLEYTGMVPLEDHWLEELDSLLGSHDARLLAKPHPLAPLPATAAYGRIHAIDSAWMHDRTLSLYQLMKGTDGLITDVSSVWVDYLLADRPMVFHFPDIAEYRRSRGIHLEPYESWVPGPLTTTGEELLAEMRRILEGEDTHRDARHTARERFHRYPDEHSSARVLDELGLR